MTLDRVWITKWVLQRGILVAEKVQISDTGASIMVTVGKKILRFSGREWHQSEARAILRALEVINERRRITAKQLEKLAQMENRFDQGNYVVTPIDDEE